ncbi:MAG: Ig-like domain-containing protein [Bacteroidales bacterium]
MKKHILLLFQLVICFTITAQTTLFSDGFENGKGSWIFSGSGGNSYALSVGNGVNGSTSIRNKYIYSPNFIISPAVTFGINKAYKVRFAAKVATANNASRKVEVYYNSTAASNANDVYVGTTSTITGSFVTFTLDNIVNPPTGTKYIILKVIDTGASPTYNFCDIDNFEFIETGNFPPTVSITSPTNNDIHTAGTSLSVNVNASDVDGSVSKVNLYYRGEFFGSLMTPPYNFSIPNLPIGASPLYAKAFDNVGDSAVTAIVTITGVNVAPTCVLTAPASNVSINQGSVVTLSATASDADGSISDVSFYVNGSKVSTVQTAPYTFDWSNPNPGSYVVSAIATDNTGLATTSGSVTITSNATTTGYLITESFEDGATDWLFSNTAGGNEWKVYDGEGVNGTKAMRRKSSVDVNFIRYSTPLYFSAGAYTIKFSGKASTTNSGYKLEGALINGSDTIWSSLSTELPTTYASQTLTLNCPLAGYYSFLFRFRPLATQSWKYLWVDDILLSGPGGFPNAEPIVKILTPTNSSELILNSPTDLTTFAYDMDGSIAKVEYYVENDKIGESTIAPYTVSWTPTFSGVFSLKAKATDNGGKSQEKVISVLVNYADRKVYDFVASSYLGGEAGSGKVWGTKVLSDGVIVLACDWGTLIPEGAVLHLLNGATINSRGAIVRIAADGKTVLSVTKIGAYAVDLAIDSSDNIYVAAGTNGLVKLNRLADKLLLTKTFAKTVYRVDAGKTGYMVALTLPGIDFDGKKWNNVSVYVMNPAGDILTSFGGASSYTNDVCIDEASQSAVEVGWRNVYTSDGVSPSLPVDIPGFKIYSFSGIKKYDGYNWSSDNTSPNWINRSDNNMADTRIARVSMGDDGLLYFMAEVSGGNHPLRYSPYDIMTKVRFVGGDNYHTLSNVGTEFHTFIARMNITTGAWIEGQSFTARQTNGAGNTIDPEHGNVAADVDGRVYFTGKSFYGTPLSREILPEISYNGGALIYIMNPTLQTRELVDRVVQKNGGRDIAVRKFANHDKTIVYGGDVAFTAGQPLNAFLYLKNPVQNTFYGAADEVAGFYAVIGGTTPETYNVTVDNQLIGTYAEGTKINLTTFSSKDGVPFSNWSGGGRYISDSTSLTPIFSVPGQNSSITSIYNPLTVLANLNTISLNIFPNPSNDFITLDAGTQLAMPIVITNMNGQIVYSGKIAGRQTISVSQYSKGVYIVTVGKARKKLIVY